MKPAELAIHPVHELKIRFAALVAEEAAAAIAARGGFAIAVPGGSAAEILLPALVETSIDWKRVAVYWVDERMVPPDDAESNYRLAKAGWLDRVPLGDDRIHRMHGEDPDEGHAAKEYAALLPARLDLVLLGVGPDGHVASLFPGHRLLRSWDRTVASLNDAPKAPPRRMTLTLKALTAARRVVVFATGAAKAAALADALQNEDSELPLALATMGEGPVSYLLDAPAAAGL